LTKAVSGPLTQHTTEGVPFGIDWGYMAMMWGPSGSGKTTLAMLTLPEADFFAHESGPERIYEYRRRLGLGPCRVLRFIFADTLQAFETGVDEGTIIGVVDMITGAPVPYEDVGPEVIFDSAQEAPDYRVIYTWWVKWAEDTGGRGIIINQATTDDTPKPKGGTYGPHKTEHRIRCDRNAFGERIAVIEKDRSGSEGQVVWNIGDGSNYVAPDFYFSVQGNPPQYDLIPVHHPKAKLVDVVKHKGKLDVNLPSPPVAFAATHSPYYEGGWVEEVDWADRARYALQFGIPYYSPLHGLITDPLSLPG